MTIAEATRSLRLGASRDEAIAAVRAALPDDAVVRDEDDGVGRFAGVRILMIIGTDRERLMLSEGTWGSLKTRLDRPQIEVRFEDEDADGVTAKLTMAPEPPPTAMSRVWDVLGSIVTVAAVIVAYHMVRSIPYDLTQVALISVGVGIAWSAISFFIPKKVDKRLEDLVRKALLSLVEDDEAVAEAGDTAVDGDVPADSDVRETRDGR